MLPAPLDLSGLWSLHAIDRPELKDEPYLPVTHPDLSLADEDVSIFEVIGDRDVLVHHPYESFTTSVQRFIEEAAADPDVLAIKQTLYRTAGSPIVNALIEAAERGKQVVVLIEIKARFDESANIAWARTLEKAGCHVVYGRRGPEDPLQAVPGRARRGRPPEAVRARRHRATTTRSRRASTRTWGCSPPTRSWPPRSAHLFNYITGFSRDKKYKLHDRRAARDARPHDRDDRARGGALDAGAAGPDHHEDEQPVR